jgi:hypothetical protein
MGFAEDAVRGRKLAGKASQPNTTSGRKSLMRFTGGTPHIPNNNHSKNAFY